MDPNRMHTRLAPSWAAWLAMAFRPFYLLGSLLAVVNVLLWGWGIAPPFGGATSRVDPLLTGLLWHGHEMVWGFGGAIVVGFLHTAVTNWTGLPPLAGIRLGALVLLWLITRVAATFSPSLLGIAIPAALFWLAAAETLWFRVWKRQQVRNYPIPLLVLVLGALELGFLASIGDQSVWSNPLAFLEAGVFAIAAIIAFMGLRVISFFTSRALSLEQVPTPAYSLGLTVLGAEALACALLFDAPRFVVLVLSVATGVAYLERSVRWHHPRIWENPMVWVLHLGFAATGLGILAFGLAVWSESGWRSAVLHLITVGGMGWMILGMITRTALGHTGGNPNRAPRGLRFAFFLIGAATATRLFAAAPVSWAGWSLRLSALFFASAFVLYLTRFIPRLIRPRPDGRPG